MDNSKFRALLATPREEKASAAAPAEMTAEERARRKAKQQASHERRMAIEKRRQEALAEANRYTDRAAQRRKEESRQAKEEGVATAAFTESLYDDEIPDAATLSTVPTVAQLGGREDLVLQQHRVTIAQSKYLGGDIEHTHLVKGLDFALLQKTRADLSASAASVAAERKVAAEKVAAPEAVGRNRSAAASRPIGAAAMPFPPLPSSYKAAATSASATVRPAAAADASTLSFRSDMVRELYGVLLADSGAAQRARPNRALTEGRLVYVYEITAEAPGTLLGLVAALAMADEPSVLIRSTDDLSVVRPRGAVLHDAALSTALLSRLTKIMTYGGSGWGCSDRERHKHEKKEKEKSGSSSWDPGTLLTMRPLPAIAPTDAATTAPATISSATPAAATARADRCGAASAGGAAPRGAPTIEPAASAASAQTAASVGRAPLKPPVEDDVDDIFGEGVGSDYVCEPSAEQLRRAAREVTDAAVLREAAAAAAPAALASGAPAGGSEREHDGVDDDAPDDAPGDAPGDAADALLRSVMASGSAAIGQPPLSATAASATIAGSACASARMRAVGEAAWGAVMGEDDELDDMAILRMSAAKKAGAQPPPSLSKDLKMSAAMTDDSYGECFPDTYEGCVGYWRDCSRAPRSFTRLYASAALIRFPDSSLGLYLHPGTILGYMALTPMMSLASCAPDHPTRPPTATIIGVTLAAAVSAAALTSRRSRGRQRWSASSCRLRS